MIKTYKEIDNQYNYKYFYNCEQSWLEALDHGRKDAFHGPIRVVGTKVPIRMHILKN